MAVVSVEERIALIQVIKIGTQDFEAAVLVGVAGRALGGEAPRHAARPGSIYLGRAETRLNHGRLASIRVDTRSAFGQFRAASAHMDLSVGFERCR